MIKQLVELSDANSAEGLAAIAAAWRTMYPEAKAVCSYALSSKVVLTLELPQAWRED